LDFPNLIRNFEINTGSPKLPDLRQDMPELILKDDDDRNARNWPREPPRDCRRPFGLSYAAMAGCSSVA